MKITIRFQGDYTFEPIVVDGNWPLAEHLLQQYGDEYKFVPARRMKVINRSKNTFISYVGTLAKTGTGAVLYMTDAIGENIEQWQHYTINDVDGDLSQYIMDEEYCYEEDWRE